jgi:hypothetical protein
VFSETLMQHGESPKTELRITVPFTIDTRRKDNFLLNVRGNFAARIIEEGKTSSYGDTEVTSILYPPVSARIAGYLEMGEGNGWKVVEDPAGNTLWLFPNRRYQIEVSFSITGEADSRKVSLEFSPVSRDLLRKENTPWEQGLIAQWDLGTIVESIENVHLSEFG